jgi:hypothetical protein
LKECGIPLKDMIKSSGFNLYFRTFLKALLYPFDM